MPNAGLSSKSEDGKDHLQMPLQLLGPNIRDWSQSKSRRSHDHSFPEGIISGRTQKWKRGLFYDFKILLVVVILAQAFHITHQYLFLKFAEAWPEAEKSLTEFSADRGVTAFKPLSPGLTN